MMRAILIAAVAAALAGCATTPPPPVVVTSAQRVEVPVEVPCKAAPVARPTWALDVLPAGVDDYIWARAALAEIEQHKGYEGQLVAAVAACQ